MALNMYKYFLLISLSLLQWCCTVTCDCIAPEEPIKCSSGNSNCTITNFQGSFPDRSTCRAADAVYPTTEAELILAVSNATMKNRKIKVATRYSHSVPKLVCPDGYDSLIISTKKLNQVLKVDKEAKTITVQSGMTLKQLIEEAAKAELALPHSPYWWGLTVGGMLGTGAHGSSLWIKGSAVHDYVAEIRIISPGEAKDGYYRSRTLKEGDTDLEAAKVSLGVLGVISQVTFKLESLFKRSITYRATDNDKGLAEEALNFGKKHEFGDIQWYPSQREVIYRIDDRVPSTTPGNGVNNFFPFRSNPATALEANRNIEEVAEALGYADLKCLTGNAVTATLEAIAFGLTNDGEFFKGYPVIGYQNRLQSAGGCIDPGGPCLLQSYCPWDPRIDGQFFFLNGFSLGASQVKNFILDVQKLVDLEPKSLCGLELYNGILMRYVTASTAYLGKDEDGIDFDIAYYRSNDPLTPRMFEDILEEIEQMGVFKYGGMPHWGKNRNVAFEGAIKKYKDAEKFLDVKQRYDPLGLFSSDWTDQVLGLKEGLSIYKNGCALEGLCICSEDIHCAPNKGYFCKPGRVYKEARVCRKGKSIEDI